MGERENQGAATVFAFVDRGEYPDAVYVTYALVKREKVLTFREGSECRLGEDKPSE